MSHIGLRKVAQLDLDTSPYNPFHMCRFFNTFLFIGNNMVNYLLNFSAAFEYAYLINIFKDIILCYFKRLLSSLANRYRG